MLVLLLQLWKEEKELRPWLNRRSAPCFFFLCTAL